MRPQDQPTRFPVALAEAASDVGLRYVNTEEDGISRRRAGRGFSYRGADGQTIRDKAELRRIRALAVPPAWTEVWICADDRGHIQAVGRDQKRRKQYRYHPRFRELRETNKFERLTAFALLLPKIRARVAQHMALRGLPREKVLATTVYLLETTLIRIGNNDYARQNRSYGVTTLRRRHVEVRGSQLKFHFTAKSGKVWRLKLTDRRAARIVRACQELPGQNLLQYVDGDGRHHPVTSDDVNRYLREIASSDVTAKDFRTWAATVEAAIALCEAGEDAGASPTKKMVKLAIERVAARLGNTPTICRKCYVHPQIIEVYLEGALRLSDAGTTETELRRALGSLRPEEAAVLTILTERCRA